MLRAEEPHVVILGGGFGGLAAARVLGSRGAGRVRVTLIDRQNHHLFQPLLYQVATAALAAPDIAAPIRKILRRHRNITVLMATVLDIDRDARTLRIAGDHGQPPRTIAWDHLIVATGMETSWFGNDAWADHAPGLKSIADALNVRARVLGAFEAAEREEDPERRREWTTFAVVGAGPTGVELAGALAEIAGRTLARDFRRFDPTTTRVVLLEGGDRVLPSFAPELGTRALDALRQLGIDVRLGTRVTDVRADGVTLRAPDGTEATLRARTVLWAAGLRASPLTASLRAPLDRAGRVRVTPDLTLPDDPRVHIVGDLLALEQDGQPLPGVAQVALQSGQYVADALLAGLDGRKPPPFRYVDRGSMATIGRARAVADVSGHHLSGLPAWLLWIFVHLLFLVDFRSRIAVLLDWAWAWLTWHRSSRVILESTTAPRESGG